MDRTAVESAGGSEQRSESGEAEEVKSSGASKMAKTAKIIKTLSQSSFKNVPSESAESNGTDKVERQGSTDSTKELSKASKVANFIRSLSKQSIETKETPGSADSGDTAGSKVSKAAKLVRQLSKTAMMMGSNTPSIDEEGEVKAEAAKANEEGSANQAENPRDVSKAVKASQVFKRLSEQSLERERATLNGTRSEGKDAVETEAVDVEVDEAAKDGEKEEEDDDAASREAVLGDDDAENPDEGFEETADEGIKDPAQVQAAAALVRQLSRQSVTRAGSTDSGGGGSGNEGDKPEGGGKRFKGKWRRSVRDKSHESSVEVQEKIEETPEKEGAIAEEKEENEDDKPEVGGTTPEVKAEQQEVVTRQPTATADTDGPQKVEPPADSVNITKPKTGFCPCL